MKSNIFLSHTLNINTPSYGNRDSFLITKKSSIKNGDIANNSYIQTTAHIGTHIDLPYHFYEEGQTIDNYKADFWVFKNIGFIEINSTNNILYKEVISEIELKKFKSNIELLIIKTGIEKYREQSIFWENNFGLSPELYDYLIKIFPKLRVIGFDSISVSSFTNREIGRKAHYKFLNPNKPILLLEDMHLSEITTNTNIKEVIIAPLRIEKCDGLPCTVFAKIK